MNKFRLDFPVLQNFKFLLYFVTHQQYFIGFAMSKFGVMVIGPAGAGKVTPLYCFSPGNWAQNVFLLIAYVVIVVYFLFGINFPSAFASPINLLCQS